MAIIFNKTPVNKYLLSLGVTLSSLVVMTGCATDLCKNVGCSGHGQCVSDGTNASCACTDGYSAYKTYCVAPQKPLADLPEYYEPDLSAMKPHPITGMNYLSNILNVFAVEGHNAAQFRLLVDSVGGRAVAYDPDVRWYMIEFPLDISFEDYTAAKETIEASPLTKLASKELQDSPQ